MQPTNQSARCPDCQNQGLAVTSLGVISISAFKLVNAAEFKGAHIERSNGMKTVLTEHSIEWLVLDGDKPMLIISVGDGVKTILVDRFYEQNAWFDKMIVKTDHEVCRKKLIKAGISVI